MPAATDNATEAYMHNAAPSIALTRARAAQHYVCVVKDEAKLPPWLTVRTDSAKSDSLTKLAADAVQSLDTSRTKADVAIEQLLRLAEFDADWDGNDAAKPLDYSIKDARKFIRSLAPESLIPRATLHADGHAILFVRDADIYAELEFLGDKKIGFYARRGEQKWSDEFSFDGRSLPEGLSRIGFSL